MEAETHMAAIAHRMMVETGERPFDLMSSRYNHHFYGLLDMGWKSKGDREVVAYRWRHYDGHERITPFWYSEEEAHKIFGGRWHEPVEETRKIMKVAIV